MQHDAHDIEHNFWSHLQCVYKQKLTACHQQFTHKLNHKESID